MADDGKTQNTVLDTGASTPLTEDRPAREKYTGTVAIKPAGVPEKSGDSKKSLTMAQAERIVSTQILSDKTLKLSQFGIVQSQANDFRLSDFTSKLATDIRTDFKGEITKGRAPERVRSFDVQSQAMRSITANATLSTLQFHRTQSLPYMKKSLALGYKKVDLLKKVASGIGSMERSLLVKLEAIKMNTGSPELAKQSFLKRLRSEIGQHITKKIAANVGNVFLDQYHETYNKHAIPIIDSIHERMSTEGKHGGVNGVIRKGATKLNEFRRNATDYSTSYNDGSLTSTTKAKLAGIGAKALAPAVKLGQKLALPQSLNGLASSQLSSKTLFLSRVQPFASGNHKPYYEKDRMPDKPSSDITSDGLLSIITGWRNESTRSSAKIIDHLASIDRNISGGNTPVGNTGGGRGNRKRSGGKKNNVSTRGGVNTDSIKKSYRNAIDGAKSHIPNMDGFKDKLNYGAQLSVGLGGIGMHHGLGAIGDVKSRISNIDARQHLVNGLANGYYYSDVLRNSGVLQEGRDRLGAYGSNLSAKAHKAIGDGMYMGMPHIQNGINSLSHMGSSLADSTTNAARRLRDNGGIAAATHKETANYLLGKMLPIVGTLQKAHKYAVGDRPEMFGPPTPHPDAHLPYHQKLLNATGRSIRSGISGISHGVTTSVNTGGNLLGKGIITAGGIIAKAPYNLARGYVGGLLGEHYHYKDLKASQAVSRIPGQVVGRGTRGLVTVPLAIAKKVVPPVARGVGGVVKNSLTRRATKIADRIKSIPHGIKSSPKKALEAFKSLRHMTPKKALGGAVLAAGMFGHGAAAHAGIMPHIWEHGQAVMGASHALSGLGSGAGGLFGPVGAGALLLGHSALGIAKNTLLRPIAAKFGMEIPSSLTGQLVRKGISGIGSAVGGIGERLGISGGGGLLSKIGLGGAGAGEAAGAAGGLATAGVGLAGMGVKYLSNKYLKGKAKRVGTTAGSMMEYGAMGATLGSIVPGLGTLVGGGIGAAVGAIVENSDLIGKGLKYVGHSLGGMGSMVKSMIPALGMSLLGPVGMVAALATNKTARNKIGNLLDNVKASFFGSKAKYDKNGKLISPAADGYLTKIRNGWTKLMFGDKNPDGSIKPGTSSIDQVTGGVTDFMKSMKDKASGAWDATKSAVSSAASTVGTAVSNTASAVGGAISSGASAVGSAIGSAGKYIAKGAKNVEEAVTTIMMGYEGGAKMNVDQGGLTKYGISAKGNPGINIAKLTEEEARGIYMKKYATGLGLEKLSPAAALVALDCSVNSGPGAARKLIAACGGDPAKMIENRRQFYNNLVAKNPGKYGGSLKGWMNRLAKLSRDVAASPGGGSVKSGGAPAAPTASAPSVGTKPSNVGQFVNKPSATKSTASMFGASAAGSAMMADYNTSTTPTSISPDIVVTAHKPHKKHKPSLASASIPTSNSTTAPMGTSTSTSAPKVTQAAYVAPAPAAPLAVKTPPVTKSEKSLSDLIVHLKANADAIKANTAALLSSTKGGNTPGVTNASASGSSKSEGGMTMIAMPTPSAPAAGPQPASAVAMSMRKVLMQSGITS